MPATLSAASQFEPVFHAIQPHLGTARDLDESVRTLKYAIQTWRPPVVGALHVTCSDEAEQECADSFQQWFVRDLLPGTRTGRRAPFRCANLGARYEWGATAIAEQHYACARPGHAFKAMLIKIDAHVAMEPGPEGLVFGRKKRFDAADSVFCGALTALLEGQHGPAVDELRDTFQSEGRDRLAALRDPEVVPPRLRSLYAAAASARLQARRAILDIQDRPPQTPTIYLVVPCVTVNKAGRDTEIVCGCYVADTRDAKGADVLYWGLGDDPAQYAFEEGRGLLRLRDPYLDAPRPARDHRALILEAVEAQPPVPVPETPELRQAVAAAQESVQFEPHVARAAVKSLLWILADLLPVPLALLLFAKGLVSIHHVYAAHRLARGEGSTADARRLVASAERRLDAMPLDRVSGLLDWLTRRFRA